MLILSGMCGHCCEHFFLSCVNTVNVREWMFWVYGGGDSSLVWAHLRHFGGTTATTLPSVVAFCTVKMKALPQIAWLNCTAVSPFYQKCFELGCLVQQSLFKFSSCQNRGKANNNSKVGCTSINVGFSGSYWCDASNFHSCDSLLVCHFVQKACNMALGSRSADPSFWSLEYSATRFSQAKESQ